MELNLLDKEINEVITSIDDILGPSEQRYFGEGYKRTQYECNINYDKDNAQGLVNVLYKTDWSQKNTQHRRPHMSTIDAFLIAGRVSYGIIKRHYQLSSHQSSQAWIRHVSIKAGSDALEDLGNVRLSAELSNTTNSPDSLFGTLTRVKTNLGSMEIEVVIDHEAMVEHSCSIESITDDDEYFTNDFRLRSCHLANNTFYDSTGAVSSELLFQCSGKPSTGAMGQYPYALMMVDWLTCFAQLSQLVMYRLDKLDRSKTYNLWMRSVSVTTPYPIIPRRKHMLTLCSMKNSLVKKKDFSWRLATVNGAVSGHPEFSITAKLCHQLPQGESA
ncbi:AvrD family protein [Vibrio spartinae]|uniref:Pseudomonas avirulence D protein (AvrD) n=1 Tax=Vibrio spartinae TaxID=1918945 RepID=A0A1N6M941_9VIBR|nr:AvrD family protein [Vibrio spartinae]SIO95965.1 Pseudomonas avirulence D protein (AvrD) [Vibrio spartinae]